MASSDFDAGCLYGRGDDPDKCFEPASLRCPLSKAMFRDPVIIICTGYTYERTWILKHFESSLSDPITGETVSGELQVNRAVRDSVEEWIHSNRDITPQGWEDKTIPDPDKLYRVPLNKMDDILEIQSIKWRELRSRLKELGCKNMQSVILITNSEHLVKEIHLSGLNIPEVPEQIYDFPYLEALYIDGNRIQSISPKIANLKNLKLLNAANNQLESIPPEILKLKKLHYLNLAHNHLSSLPKNTYHLRELRELWLNNNNLADIDLDISKMGVLSRLYISGNLLEKYQYASGLIDIVKG